MNGNVSVAQARRVRSRRVAVREDERFGYLEDLLELARVRGSLNGRGVA
jgi:hypothetical protein